MSSSVNPADDLSPVKRALLQLKEMRTRVEAAERTRTEPIAIVGIGCRFPGAVDTPDAFWELLADGRDAITEVPPDRWDLNEYFDADPDAAGKMCTRFGGFVRGIDRFDAAFFGITPREASAMDPQQRQLLEVAWEALEHGGQAADRLMGAPVGVFVGLATSDYMHLELRATPVDRIDPYLATGGCGSVAAGRISYVLGLQGPAVTLDTACSSSLVAVHLAVQSLRARECQVAIAAGSSAILLPELTINFSRARMMAPDGRCKTFDARADGYVRSEGCGAVVLKRLTDAQADGDRILAVVRGSSVNQDGRSSGLTVPNGLAQERVIRDALSRGGVDPAHVDYIEAHGTGTSLGDPIELRALGAVLTRQRSADAPLLVGSVKTNIGHLEAAAGIAGLIKVVLALQHDEIPSHLHLREPNPLLDWKDLRISIPVERMPWPRTDHTRTAGVSSFGFSGTNAHVILQEPPEAVDATAGPPAPDRSAHALTVSARTPEALRAAVTALREHLREHPDVAFADICHTRNARRVHFGHRLGLVARTAEEADALLRSWSDGQPNGGVVSGHADGGRPRVAFLFTGHGSQHADMSRVLYDTEPVFRASIDRSAAILAPIVDRPLVSLLYGADATLLNQTCYAQPALFAVEYALAELWRSWGVEPDAVLGHSLGEDVAAAVAGVFSHEDGLVLVARRGRMMQNLAKPGEMHAVFAPLNLVVDAIQGAPGVAIAAVNGPEQVAIAGEAAALVPVLGRLKAAGLKMRNMSPMYAFHSPLMGPVLGPLEDAARSIAFSEPRITFVSNVTGRVATAGEVSVPSYWRRHVSEPVRFHQAVQTLIGQGIKIFVEIGPDGVLLRMTERSLPESQPASAVALLPSLHQGQDDEQRMLASAIALYAHGVNIDWAGVDRPFPRRPVALPTYPFERQRFWFEGHAAEAPATPQKERAASWSAIAAAARQQSVEGPLDLKIETYAAKWATLDRLATSFIAAAVVELNLFPSGTDTRTVAEIMATSAIGEPYRRLVGRWLDRLTVAGLLRKSGDAYTPVAPLPGPNADAVTAADRACFTDYPSLLEYVERCSTSLAAVLTGRESPLELLFPGGSSELAEGLYEHSPSARYLNAIVRAVVQASGRSKPGLRILEIGGGTGATTASLLPVLEGTSATYTFTDVGPLFLNRAQERFAAYDFVQYGLLDIEKPGGPQGYAEHGYDLIVGANVVHATRNLDQTLANLRELLVPGGILAVVEATEHPSWFDMTTGLISGWQIFEDGWRGSHPLLEPDVWKQVVTKAGFPQFDVFPEKGSPASVLGQHVIVAQGPALTGVTGTAGATSAACVANVANGTSGAVVAARGSLDEMRELPAEERHERLVAIVRSAVMQVLRLDQSKTPDRQRRLMELGVDSLMAVELRNVIGKALQTPRRLPATLIFDHPTTEAIARFIDRTFITAPAAAPPVSRGDATASAAPVAVAPDDFSSMDDADVEALLNKRLEKI